MVLSPAQVLALLHELCTADGSAESQDLSLIGRLLYGTGMRIAEALRLRVKDIDFSRRTIVVREGKGGKDRALMLPDALREPLRQQLSRSHALWSKDRAAGRAGVWMPDALARKYPRAGQTWAWHWVFPQAALSRDPRSGEDIGHQSQHSGGRSGSLRKGACDIAEGGDRLCVVAADRLLGRDTAVCRPAAGLP